MSLFADSFKGGDIWSSAFTFESPLKDLLDQPDFTLTDLLNEDELLQEVKALNGQLVDFLSENKNLDQLMDFLTKVVNPVDPKVTEEAPAQAEDLSGSAVMVGEGENGAEDESRKKFIPIPPEANLEIRYPYMACEVICCDVAQIVDAIVDSSAGDGEGGNAMGNALLEKFFSVLDNPSPLPPRLAGYFEKVLTVLFRRRPAALTGFINAAGKPLFEKFVAHLNNYSVMQLLKRLVAPSRDDLDDEEGWGATAEDEFSTMQCNWGQDVEYVTILVERMISSKDVEMCSNGAELLVSLIQQLALKDPILLALSDTPTASFMIPILDQALPPLEGSPVPISTEETTMTAALTLIESILLQLGGYGCVPPIDEDDAKLDCVLSTPVAFAEALVNKGYLGRVVDHLTDERLSGADWKMVNTNMVEVQKLGVARLKLVRVVEGMVLLASLEVDKVLATSDVLKVCLDLFFDFPWVSMLHQSVANLLVHIIEGGVGRGLLQKVVVKDLDLLARLLNCFKENEAACEGEKGKRLGYMGHVIIVCQAIVHASSDELDEDGEGEGGAEGVVLGEENPASSEFFGTVSTSNSYGAWSDFVMSTLATETAIQSTPLGGFSSPSRDGDLSEDFGLDQNDMDIAASMIASMNMVGGNGGLKLGMGGLMESLGLGEGGGEGGLGGGGAGEEEEEGGVNYDDIINKDQLTRVVMGEEDVVQVDGGDDGNDDDEEEGVATQEAWAAFGEEEGGEGGEGGLGVKVEVGDGPQFGVSPIEGGGVLGEVEEEGGAGGGGGGVKDAWGDGDPFAEFDGSSKTARDDFFG